MPILTNQPDNINFLSPLAFKFTLARAPTLNFFATAVNLPSVELGFTEIPTPFKMLPFAGDKLIYGDFQMTFKVDEDFSNYFEVYNFLDGNNLCNVFANLLVNKYEELSPNSKTEIKVINLRNFFVVRGVTSCEELCNITELFQKKKS